MIKYFINKFFKKKNESKPLPYLSDENAITFAVDSLDRPIIRISLQNLQESNAKQMAETLFLINNGSYQNQIIEMLKEIGMQDPDRMMLIKQIMNYWLEHIQRNTVQPEPVDENQPLIPPLSFSKIINSTYEK